MVSLPICIPLKLLINCLQRHLRILFVSASSDQTRRFCNVTQHPLSEARGRDRSLYSDTVLEVVKNMTVPVTVLDITSMSALRSDAHVGNWSDIPLTPDCSHWCLPGVPDMWNEIVLSYLLSNYDGKASSNYFLNIFFLLLRCIPT